MNQAVRSRAVKALVLVEDPYLPFSLIDKGTVRENMYGEQTDRAYEGLEMKQWDEVRFPGSFGESEISGFLQDVLHTLLPERDLTSEVDLFEQGKFD